MNSIALYISCMLPVTEKTIHKLTVFVRDRMLKQHKIIIAESNIFNNNV